MRRSREETAETRAQILGSAARLFRERGLDGIGVAELMGAVGLTHGGFYRHFASKDELAGQACAQALAVTRDELERRATAAPDREAFRTVVQAYLGPHHRDRVADGCAIAALGAEAARHPGPVREALNDGVAALLQLVQQQQARSGVTARQLPPHVALAAMLGALLLSRVVDDPALSEDLLRDTARHLLREG